MRLLAFALWPFIQQIDPSRIKGGVCTLMPVALQVIGILELLVMRF